MTFFSSDWHIGHEKLLPTRPRYKTIEEHDFAILNNIAEALKPSDTLYFMGDMSMKGNIIEDVLKFLKKLRINVIIIKGNHDKYPQYLRTNLINEKKINGQNIVMCHYPMMSWNKSHFNSWCLHGHLHKLETPIQGKLYNVGVDTNDFKPVSFDELVEIMKNKPDNWDFIPEGNKYNFK